MQKPLCISVVLREDEDDELHPDAYNQEAIDPMADLHQRLWECQAMTCGLTAFQVQMLRSLSVFIFCILPTGWSSHETITLFHFHISARGHAIAAEAWLGAHCLVGELILCERRH
jgi:hypothetical protein